jgi:hypothetical protein
MMHVTELYTLKTRNSTLAQLEYGTFRRKKKVHKEEERKVDAPNERIITPSRTRAET